MKTVTFVRHAKSSWDNPEWTDFDRPLNKRGLRDAPFMANIIAKKMQQPELIISSSALRAATTARCFADAFNYDQNKIRFDKNIYELGPRYIVKIIRDCNDDFNNIMVFGHNPDMTTLYSYFSGEYSENIPTCGIFCIDFDILSWKNIEDDNGTVRFFEFPKKYFPKDNSIID